MGLFRFFAPGIKENWKVVALSVIGATTFWFFNAMNKNYETKLDYPINYVFNRDSVVVVTPLTKNLEIIVSSGGWNLLRKTLRVNATPILAPLSNPTEVKYLTRSSLVPMISNQLDRLKLIYVVTDTLFFDIEKKVIKRLPINVDSLNIPLEESHRLTSAIKLSNDSVTLTGPQSIMDGLRDEVLVSFNGKTIDDNFDDKLAYQLENIVKADPKEINLQFDVDQFLYRDLIVPIEFLHFPEDSSYIADQKDLRIYYTINENFDDEIKASDFSVILDFTMLNLRDTSIAPMLMYGHEEAVDIVMSKDRVRLSYIERNRR